MRTGLALMGFGFVVARFGLFLQQLRLLDHAPTAPTYGVSLWFGTALITVGVIVNLSSAWRHVQMVRELGRGESARSRSLTQPIATAIFLALVGLAMAIYLVSIRAPANVQSQTGEEQSMAQPANAFAANRGIVDKLSTHSVDQTVDKLKNILRSKGVTLFALVDHSGEAEKIRMKMRPTRSATPKPERLSCWAAPSSAIDLPLKILVSEKDQGKVLVSYNSPEYLKERHGLPEELLQNIAVVETLAAKAGE